MSDDGSAMRTGLIVQVKNMNPLPEKLQEKRVGTRTVIVILVTQAKSAKVERDTKQNVNE
jgi:hypothetical protein